MYTDYGGLILHPYPLIGNKCITNIPRDDSDNDDDDFAGSAISNRSPNCNILRINSESFCSGLAETVNHTSQ